VCLPAIAMDALAMLSEDDDDDEVDAEDEGDADTKDVKEAKLDFNSLKRVGYMPNVGLRESEMYKRVGDEEKARKAAIIAANSAALAPAELTPQQAEQADAKAKKEEEERLELESAIKRVARDKKRAGVPDGQETNRQKNARKMKAGQATFSLKDDRDCTNPFIDSSQASHVKGYTGKRVDKSASVKQVSTLSFTS
ncbi:unnamed protein product, partial [Polarella glacialis]